MDVIKYILLLSQVTIANARAATAQLGPVKRDARPAAASRPNSRTAAKQPPPDENENYNGSASQ